MSAINLNLPVATPPPGVVANFTHPPNEATLAYSTLIISLALVTLFTWFRFLVKLCIVQKLHLEDYLIPFAWLGAVGQGIAGFIIYDFAPIIHSWDMRLSTFGRYLLWYRLGAIFYNFSVLLIKVAMLAQVLRIFIVRGSGSKTYYVFHALIWMNITYYIATIFLMVFTCQPIEKAWKPWSEGKCMEMGRIAMATATLNLVSDLAMLFLAQRVIWNVMKIDQKKRIKLSVVFLAGIVPCGFAVLCLYYNHQQIYSTDFVHDSAIMSLACYGEISSGMFVLFLPVVPRFFTYVRHKHFSAQARASSALDFSDVGLGGEASAKGGLEAKRPERDAVRSLWHISYTQRGGEDGTGEAVWGRKDDFGGKSVESTSNLSSTSSRSA